LASESTIKDTGILLHNLEQSEKREFTNLHDILHEYIPTTNIKRNEI